MPHCNFGSEEVVGKLVKLLENHFFYGDLEIKPHHLVKQLGKLTPSAAYLQAVELYRGMECHLHIYIIVG